MNRLILALTISISSTYSLADNTLNTTQEEAILTIESTSETPQDTEVSTSEGKSLKHFSLKYLEVTLGTLAFSNLIAFLHESGHAVAYKYATGFYPRSLVVQGNSGYIDGFGKTTAGGDFAGPFLGLVSAAILESMVLSSVYQRLSYLNLYWLYLAKTAKAQDLRQLLPEKGLDGFNIAKHLPGISNILKIGSMTADGYVTFSFYKSLLEKISPELGNSIIDYAPIFLHLTGLIHHLTESYLPYMLYRLSGALYVGFLAYSFSSLLYKVYTNLPEDAFEKLKERISLASAFELAYELGPHLLAALTVTALDNSKLLDFKITWRQFDRSASFFSGVLSRP